MEITSRPALVDQTIQAFVNLVLTQKFADMPKWMDFDLTVSQLRAIFLLAYYGPLTVSELARWLEIGKPAASILVQQLVQQEMAERSEDPIDRRRTFVRLTERGAGLVSDRHEMREAKFRRWLSQMSDDELAGLLRGLSRLNQIVGAEQMSADATVGAPHTEAKPARS